MTITTLCSSIPEDLGELRENPTRSVEYILLARYLKVGRPIYGLFMISLYLSA